MSRNARELIKIINRKGFLETLVEAFRLFAQKTTSLIKISILRLRGYNIDYSVLLRGNNNFFQSVKNSITISGKVTLGRATRMTAGGSGKVHIGENVLVDDSTFIMAHEKIEIGKNTTIAAFCFITDFNHSYKNGSVSVLEQGYETKPISIGKNVWIGTHCIVLPGIKIGDGSIIGAGSVVTHDVPENSIAVGNPARIVKKIKR